MKWLWAVAVLAVVATAVGVFMVLRPSHPAVPAALQTVGSDFTLHSATGDVRLSAFRGKTVLVYFGYTHCPDACPMALGVIGQAMRKLDAADGKRVAGIFISLDPRRDTPDILAKYARFFDPRIQGVTGTPDELAKVAAAWRVGYSVPDAPADSHYTVEHSTFIYLVNPEGKVANLFDDNTGPDVIARAIHAWLN